MISLFHQRRLHSLLALTGALFLVLSGQLIGRQTVAIRDARDQGLPLAADVTALQHRSTLLAQEIDVASAGDLHTGSQAERLHVFVLPSKIDRTRVLAVFDVLQTHLRSQRMLRDLSPITILDPREETISGQTVNVLPLHFTMIVRDEGLKAALSLLRISGLLTVSDTLTASQIQELISSVEAQHPSSIVSLEQFLRMDLFTFARDAQAVDRLAHAVADESFDQTLRTIVHESILEEVQSLLGGKMGDALLQAKLWPLPFLRARDVTIEKTADQGWEKVSFLGGAYGRK
ncbi:hypothetical protein HY285_04565 [Candidatus Peregrinibacteria bacterium]|nr:hypothetical protein [Candidatus Peregrinibacteria bacterium]MBI3816786.1 hypothetical protein [Candidatus Peregrinibacteria bacterium]